MSRLLVVRFPFLFDRVGTDVVPTLNSVRTELSCSRQGEVQWRRERISQFIVEDSLVHLFDRDVSSLGDAYGERNGHVDVGQKIETGRSGHIASAGVWAVGDLDDGPFHRRAVCAGNVSSHVRRKRDGRIRWIDEIRMCCRRPARVCAI